MNHLKPDHRRAGWLLAALLVLASAVPAMAANPDEHPLLDRYSVVVGGFLSTADTDLRLDLTDTDLGTRLDFEDVLDFREDSTLFRVDSSWRFGRRHQLNFGYYQLNRTATRVLAVDIEFGDETFTVDTEVGSFFNTEFLELSYTYWFRIKENHVLGVLGGVVDISVETGIGLETERLNLGRVETDATTDLPVPLVGFQYRQLLAPKLMLRVSAGVIDIGSVDDYSGTVFNLGAALEHRTFRHVSFGGSFNLIDLDFTVEKRRFQGAFEYSVSGFQAFTRIRF